MPTIAQLQAHNNLTYNFTETDITIVLNCLQRRDKTSIDQNITLGAAVSCNTSSPPQTILKPLIETINNVPHTIYLPYKVINQAHWNIVQLKISDNEVTCCRYNTDGYRYPLDEALLAIITPLFSNKKVLNNNDTKQTYQNPGQLNVNCGLICALMAHDLITNNHNYAGFDEIIAKTNIETAQKDTQLRNAISKLIDNFATKSELSNFCKPTSTNTFSLASPKINYQDSRSLSIVNMLDKLKNTEDKNLFKSVIDATEEDQVSTTAALWASLRTSPTSVSEDKSAILDPLFDDKGPNGIYKDAIDIVTAYKQQRVQEDDVISINSDTSYNYIEDPSKKYLNYSLAGSVVVTGVAIALTLLGPIGWLALTITACTLLVINSAAYYADNKNNGHNITLKEVITAILNNTESASYKTNDQSQEAQLLTNVSELTNQEKEALANKLHKKDQWDLNTVKETLAQVKKPSSRVKPYGEDVAQKKQHLYNQHKEPKEQKLPKEPKKTAKATKKRDQ